MKTRNENLEKMILECISKDPTADSVDIVIYCKLRADIVMRSVADLEEAGVIERKYSGIKSYYKIK